MRVGLWRLVACAVVLATAVAGAEPAEPMPAPAVPDVKGTDTTAERAKLQAELLALLKRMSANPSPPMPSPVPPTAVAPPKAKADPDAKSLDPVREAMNLFRDNDFELARQIFQRIDPTTLPTKEDRVFVRYMVACCHRRQGRVAEAEVIYREVANNRDDEFLAGYAQQQLSLIGSERELQAQLEQLRSRAKSK